jgi:hypothetical protein
MGRHQSAASSRRARVALGALPLVATVGAIGAGSVVMSPASSDVPLGPPSVGGGGAPAAALPLGPGLAPAPVTVLDLAATDGSVARQGVPGSTVGVRPGGGGPGGDDAPASGRATRSGATAGGGEVARVSSVRDAGNPARGGASGGGSTSGGGGGGGADGGSGGGSGDSGGSAPSGGSTSGGDGGGGGGGGGGGAADDGGGGRGGGLLGGVVGGLGSTVQGATSLLSFGGGDSEESDSVLSFGS